MEFMVEWMTEGFKSKFELLPSGVRLNWKILSDNEIEKRF